MNTHSRFKRHFTAMSRHIFLFLAVLEFCPVYRAYAWSLLHPQYSAGKEATRRQVTNNNCRVGAKPLPRLALKALDGNEGDDDSIDDPDGSSLFEELLEVAKKKGINIDDFEIDDEEDDESDVLEEPSPDDSLEDYEWSIELADRLSRFQREYEQSVQARNDRDVSTLKPYHPPKKIPDPEMTAQKVVLTVLDGLLHNDEPKPNTGAAIFLGFSSPSSSVKSEFKLSPKQYTKYLKEEYGYDVLLQHQGATIDKSSLSPDELKEYITARLKTGPASSDFVSVIFALSKDEESGCWLIESLLVKPKRRS